MRMTVSTRVLDVVIEMSSWPTPRMSSWGRCPASSSRKLLFGLPATKGTPPETMLSDPKSCRAEAANRTAAWSGEPGWNPTLRDPHFLPRHPAPRTRGVPLPFCTRIVTAPPLPASAKDTGYFSRTTLPPPPGGCKGTCPRRRQGRTRALGLRLRPSPPAAARRLPAASCGQQERREWPRREVARGTQEPMTGTHRKQCPARDEQPANMAVVVAMGSPHGQAGS